METFILAAVAEMDSGKMLLSDVFVICALLSNFIYSAFLTRFVSLLDLHLIILKTLFLKYDLSSFLICITYKKKMIYLSFNGE